MTDSITREIAENFRRLRHRAGLSQTDAGRILDVSFQQIQKYENAINRISATKLFVVAPFFKCSYAEFFGGEPSKGSNLAAENTKLKHENARLLHALKTMSQQATAAIERQSHDKVE